MLAQGFKPVGADFPVFLHPQSKEEYALARTERKSGRGYGGFVFDTSKSVSLEQDLSRRDLTINAIAEDAEGRIIDPFGGVADLSARVLRHVSGAFVEDPLRVLRVARFAARFAPLGFRVAPETRALMAEIARGDELSALVPERVFVETQRALLEARPSAYLRTLRACGALAKVFPELDALYGVPQRAAYHPEIDTGVHQELVSDAAAQLAPGIPQVAWSALTHDLGKALTPVEQWPRHLQHELNGTAPLQAFYQRLKAPRDISGMAELVCRYHLNLHRYAELRPGTRMSLLEALDALRRPERVAWFALACHADQRGRLGLSDRPYAPAQMLLDDHIRMRAVSAAPLQARGLSGPALGAALRELRVRAIAGGGRA